MNKKIWNIQIIHINDNDIWIKRTFKIIYINLANWTALLPDDSIAAVIDPSSSEAVFPEVETFTAEAMERGKEELLMYERSTAGSLFSSRPLDVETKHIWKGVGTCSHPSGDLWLRWLFTFTITIHIIHHAVERVKNHGIASLHTPLPILHFDKHIWVCSPTQLDPLPQWNAMLVSVAVFEYLEHTILLSHLKHLFSTPEIVSQLICAAKWTIDRFASQVDSF